MRKVRLGESGPEVTVICQGCGRFGSSLSERDSFAIMDRYAEAGGNFLDTAHIYAAWIPDGWGKSEITVGRWLRGSGMEKTFVVATKGGHPAIDDWERPRLAPEDIRQDLSESLERLGMGSVPLYWLHRDDPERPVGEILDVLAEAKAEGLIGSYGASNWAVPRLEAAARYAASRGIDPFVASQVAFSLALPNTGFDRPGTIAADEDTLRYHEQTGLPLVGYSAQAKGFFSGKYTRGVSPPDTERGRQVNQAYFSARNFDRLERARDLAARLGRSPNEVNLAYVLNQAFPTVAIVGSRDPGQIAASCRAADLELSGESVGFLRGL